MASALIYHKDEQFIELAQHALHSAGWNVLITTSAGQMLMHASKANFDLAIVDLENANIEIRDLIVKLITVGKCQAPLVIAAAKVAAGDRERASVAGCIGVIDLNRMEDVPEELSKYSAFCTYSTWRKEAVWLPPLAHQSIHEVPT